MITAIMQIIHPTPYQPNERNVPTNHSIYIIFFNHLGSERKAASAASRELAPRGVLLASLEEVLPFGSQS